MAPDIHSRRTLGKGSAKYNFFHVVANHPGARQRRIYRGDRKAWYIEVVKRTTISLANRRPGCGDYYGFVHTLLLTDPLRHTNQQ